MADTLMSPPEPPFEVLMQRHGGAGTAWRLGRISEDALFSDTGRPIGPNVAKNVCTPNSPCRHGLVSIPPPDVGLTSVSGIDARGVAVRGDGSDSTAPFLSAMFCTVHWARSLW